MRRSGKEGTREEGGGGTKNLAAAATVGALDLVALAAEAVAGRLHDAALAPALAAGLNAATAAEGEGDETRALFICCCFAQSKERSACCSIRSKKEGEIGSPPCRLAQKAPCGSPTRSGGGQRGRASKTCDCSGHKRRGNEGEARRVEFVVREKMLCCLFSCEFVKNQRWLLTRNIRSCCSIHTNFSCFDSGIFEKQQQQQTTTKRKKTLKGALQPANTMLCNRTFSFRAGRGKRERRCSLRSTKNKVVRAKRKHAESATDCPHLFGLELLLGYAFYSAPFGRYERSHR